MSASAIHQTSQDDGAVNAAATRLVQLWRRVSALQQLPLKETDREEIRQQKELIKAYVLTIDGIRRGANPRGRAAQSILEDIDSFSEEVNRALDEAGIG